MDIHFVTYSDEVYKDRQVGLNNIAKGEFDKVHSYDREWLVGTDFYKENRDILDEERGNGYWLWKPYIILETLKKVNDGDVVFYLDCGDVFRYGVKGFLQQYFDDNSSLLTFGVHPQIKYTKRDCFVKMDCDTEEYHKAIQLEAGIIAFKKTKEIITVIEEWLEFAKDENIITDMPNVMGDNYPVFIDHRHDQSVMTNLAIKHNLNCNGLLRRYITCNVN